MENLKKEIRTLVELKMLGADIKEELEKLIQEHGRAKIIEAMKMTGYYKSMKQYL